jgi:hypothetical protein
MPLYEYENLKTGEKFQKVLPMARRKEPCTAPYIKLAIVAPNVLTISDSKGKEDKLREDLHTKAQVAKKEKQVLESDTKYKAIKKELKKTYGTSKKRTKKAN